MQTERWHKHELEIKGFPVKLISCRIDQSYLTEVESISSGATIALAIAATPEEARKNALETATKRLLRTPRFDLELTVGG